jgi:hypothetical protein
MRAGAAHFALVFAYTTAAVNVSLTVVDLVAQSWLTAGLQLTLSLAGVCAAYLVTRAERHDDPPSWWLLQTIQVAAIGLVLVGMFTLALFVHTVRAL